MPLADQAPRRVRSHRPHGLNGLHLAGYPPPGWTSYARREQQRATASGPVGSRMIISRARTVLPSIGEANGNGMMMVAASQSNSSVSCIRHHHQRTAARTGRSMCVWSKATHLRGRPTAPSPRVGLSSVPVTHLLGRARLRHCRYRRRHRTHRHRHPRDHRRRHRHHHQIHNPVHPRVLAGRATFWRLRVQISRAPGSSRNTDVIAQDAPVQAAARHSHPSHHIHLRHHHRHRPHRRHRLLPHVLRRAQPKIVSCLRIEHTPQLRVHVPCHPNTALSLNPLLSLHTRMVQVISGWDAAFLALCWSRNTCATAQAVHALRSHRRHCLHLHPHRRLYRRLHGRQFLRTTAQSAIHRAWVDAFAPFLLQNALLC